MDHKLAQLIHTPVGALIVPGGSAYPMLTKSDLDSCFDWARRHVRKQFVGYIPKDSEMPVVVDQNWRRRGEHRVVITWRTLLWQYYVEDVRILNPFSGSESLDWKVTESVIQPTMKMIDQETIRFLAEEAGQKAAPAPLSAPKMNAEEIIKKYFDTVVQQKEAHKCYFCYRDTLMKISTGFVMCPRCITQHIVPALVGE